MIVIGLEGATMADRGMVSVVTKSAMAVNRWN